MSVFAQVWTLSDPSVGKQDSRFLSQATITSSAYSTQHTAGH
jgi:hypothetical protein